MVHVDEIQFDAMIAKAMDELPQAYISGLQNVVIVVDNEPTPEQRQRQNLHPSQTLLGLYEGIPLTRRGSNYNLVLPDKITLFKTPLEHTSSTISELQENIKRTLWHEIAHFYGLEHDRIHHLEQKSKKMIRH